MAGSSHDRSPKIAATPGKVHQHLGIAAHDLRNPASGIVSASDFLIEDAADILQPEHIKLLKSIRSAGVFMLRLINESLASSKLESSPPQIDSQPTNLVSVIEQVLVVNRSQANHKGIKLHAHAANPAIFLNIDPIKLSQVIDNLVSNAIKFSYCGGKVEVCSSAIEERVTISVRDEGPGILADELETIFDPFNRFLKATGQDGSSIGLGLAISKRLVEGFGGQLRVETEPSYGSKFTVSMPITVDARGGLSHPIEREVPERGALPLSRAAGGAFRTEGDAKGPPSTSRRIVRRLKGDRSLPREATDELRDLLEPVHIAGGWNA